MLLRSGEWWVSDKDNTGRRDKSGMLWCCQSMMLWDLPA